MRSVQVKTGDPRDRYRRTMRILPFSRFKGLPLPGELVDLHLPGTRQPVPGVINWVHMGDEMFGVEPDFQTIMGR